MTTASNRQRRRGAWGAARPTPRDLLAGGSVALVLIPQALAYAEVAGLPAVHGLYAAAVPLLAAAVFASCPYLQTGPVALTALLTYGALIPLAEAGTSAYVGAAALLALVVGATRALIGFLKSGWVSYLMSQPVLTGFTSGAAILIIFTQVPGAVGLGAEGRGPVAGLLAVAGSPETWHPMALVMTAMTMLITVVSRRVHPLVPGALLAAIVGVVFSVRMGYTGPVVGQVSAQLPPLSGGIPWGLGPGLLLPGVVIALVGFAESAAIAQVFASRERARWNPDQEFLSQGMANLAAGVFSGFPVGGSFSRSSLNHLSGAVTRWSGAFTGVGVLLILPFTSLLAPLPKAVLSGVVITAVAGLVRPRKLVGLWRLSRVQALVAWATFALCLLLSPRVEQAVLLGVLISLAVHVWRERRAAFDIEMDGRTLRIDARGVLWFASAPRLQEQILSELADATDVDEVVIDLSGLGRIDLTGALVLRRILDEVGAVGVRGTLVEVPPHAAKLLDNVIRLRPSDTQSG
ncbi:MAG: SulP family inorganic anion transporter [Gemmatimonadetes bacterium]|nr:SulP family inorganic anion transporter [Gemmatimonadota bacterium]